MEAPTVRSPAVAILGRPNVGKSTLFNRLVGSRKAVVAAARGTTRDRLYGYTSWRGVALALIDTGGFEPATGDGLARAIHQQVRQALREADVVLAVCDGREGLVPADEMLMEELRPTGKPVVLAINKMDHRLVVPPDFFALGVANPIPVSALHGRGTGELLDEVVAQVTGRGPAAPGPAPAVAVAIIGRQNVGKSSLLNAWLREERVIVHEDPGTTRDAVDTLLTAAGQTVCLVDTAGLRRRSKVKAPVELFAMSRTLQALRRCDLAVVVLDAAQGVTREDRRIAAKVCEAGRCLVLLVNKWDLVRGPSRRTLTEAVHRALPHASFAPVLAVSAKTGFQVSRALQTILWVARAMRRGMDDAGCLALLQQAWAARLPPRWRGRVVRLRAARWVSGLPAWVELVTQPAGGLGRAYQHYLLNALRASPRLSGVPIRLVVRGA